MDSPHGDQDGLDDLDAALLVWAREIPSLDPLTEGVVERIHILAHHLNESMSETLAELQLSSGAMLNRLDRMEKAGLIRRLPDPSDRRGTLVEPTEAGHAAWDATVGKQGRREQDITAVLSEDQRVELHRLLRTLMRAFPESGHGFRARETSGED